MNIYKKMIASVAFLVCALTPAFAVSGSSLALFEGAKGQANCGANLTDTANSTSGCSPNGDSEKKVDTLLTTAINLLSAIVGVIAVIVIIISGIKFITSQGDSGAITTARNSIIYAFIGLIIVGLAQAIVHFVLNRVSS